MVVLCCISSIAIVMGICSNGATTGACCDGSGKECKNDFVHVTLFVRLCDTWGQCLFQKLTLNSLPEIESQR